MVPFGAYLDAQGFPAGVVWAAAITLFEMAGSVCLLLGRFVRVAAPGHILILLSGLVMVHRAHGWWVVGAGRGGMEFSVLLIACLAALTWDDVARRRGRVAPPPGARLSAPSAPPPPA